MNIIKYPARSEWHTLLSRPHRDAAQLTATVRTVLDKVRQEGDAAVKEYEEQFDHVKLDTLAVSQAEIDEAAASIDPSLLQAIQLAHDNIAEVRRTEGGGGSWRRLLAEVSAHREGRTIHPRWYSPPLLHSAHARHTSQDSRLP